MAACTVTISWREADSYCASSAWCREAKTHSSRNLLERFRNSERTQESSKNYLICICFQNGQLIRSSHERFCSPAGNRVRFDRDVGAKGGCGAGFGWSLCLGHPADIYANRGAQRSRDIQVRTPFLSGGSRQRTFIERPLGFATCGTSSGWDPVAIDAKSARRRALPPLRSIHYAWIAPEVPARFANLAVGERWRRLGALLLG